MSEKDKNKLHKEGSFDDLGDIDDLLGLNDEEFFIPFQCIDCGCEDPVPEFIVDEFSWDLKEGEELEMYCPKCNGTMRRIGEEKAED